MNFPTSFWLGLALLSGTLTKVMGTEAASKLLVVNGWNEDQKAPTELLDLENPSESCLLPDFPDDLIWSTGGYTGDGAIICGGRNPHTWSATNQCYQLENGEFVQTDTNMTRPRSLAGSVITTNEELWILGGYNQGGPLEICELYGSVRTTDDLSGPIYGHCVAKINATTAIGKHYF